MTTPQHRARKRFGQNFLVDSAVIQRIVSAIRPQTDDNIVEIGPGQGALTGLLLKYAPLRVIELDYDLVAILQQQFPGLDIHQGDALKVDFSPYAEQGKLRIVGNLPYNISTPLIFHLLRFHNQIKDMHFMLQRELVQRMAAEPGSKTYGRLSVMCQYHCLIEHLFDVPPEAFRPRPRVMSAIVRLTPRPAELVATDLRRLDQVVKLAFGQRRKTLRNSLKAIENLPLDALDVDLGLRAEQLSVRQFIQLSNRISSLLDKHQPD